MRIGEDSLAVLAVGEGCDTQDREAGPGAWRKRARSTIGRPGVRLGSNAVGRARSHAED